MAVLLDILAAGVRDTSGATLASGSVYVYEVGTTTKKTVYSDASGTSTVSNPVTLDAAGKAEVYVDSACRLVIYDSLGGSVADIESVGDAQALSGPTINLGDSSTDLIAPNGRWIGDIIPFSDDQYDIGSATKAWAEGHFEDFYAYSGVVISGTSGHSVSEEFANEVFEEYARSTGASVGLRGLAISSSCSTFSHGTSTPTDVTNLSVTIITSGRPVFIGLISDGDIGDAAYRSLIAVEDTSGNNNAGASGTVRILRSTTDISRQKFNFLPTSATSTNSKTLEVPPSTIWHVDTGASAGSNTYKVQVNVDSSNRTIRVERCKLIAYEL